MKTILFPFFMCFALLQTNARAQNAVAPDDSAALRKALNFEIVFGVYHDDSYQHKFEAQERTWVLKDGVLIYRIDAHDQRYADTLKLRNTDLLSMVNFIKENSLMVSINKDLSKDYADKMGYTESVNGSIQYRGQIAKLSITSNSSSNFDDDPQVKVLKELESILYEIAGNMRN
jgi:hypothetical protein